MSIFTRPSANQNVRHNVFELTAQGDFLGAFSLVVAAAPEVDDDPGLWDYLARRFIEHGAEGPAVQAQQLMWDAGFRSDPMALALARAANDRGEGGRAARYVTAQFGVAPDDGGARLQLARALASRDPAAASALLEGQAFTRAEDAVLFIDLLREQDRFAEALAVCAAEAPRFAQDERFGVRRARIAEAQGKWREALSEWRAVRAEVGAVADMQALRLLMRLEDTAEAEAQAAALLAGDLPASLRYRLALVLGDEALAGAVLHRAWLETGGSDLWESEARQILNAGHAALLVWAEEQGAALPPDIAALLSRAFTPRLRREVAALSFDAAYRLESPAMFLGEMAALAAPPDPVLGVAGPRTGGRRKGPVLLVNATLASGGAERQLVTLVRALLAAGLPPRALHCAFFSLSAERGHAHFLADLKALGVAVHDLQDVQPSPMLGLTRAGAVVGAMPGALREDIVRLDALVERLKPAVVHGWQDRASVAAGWVGLTRQVPQVVMSMRNMQPGQRGQRQRYLADIYRAYLGVGGVAITANSRAGSCDYEDWLGLEPGRVATLVNALPTSEIPLTGPASPAVLTRAGQAPVIGGVFRLAANKRPLLWLDTVTALAARLGRPVTARIVGRGPFEGAVEEAASARPQLSFSLGRGLSQVTDIYRGFDALLLMSRVEGLPNVLIEAQALGLPVAACDVGGVREAVLADGPAAALLLPAEVAPEDAAARIADWLPGALAADPALRRAFVDQTFGLGLLGERTAAIYRGGA